MITRLCMLLLILAGCASTGGQPTTSAQRIEFACAGSSTALKALTAANDAGKLSRAQQAAVIRAVGVITPICSGPAVPTLDAAKQALFLQAVAELEGMQP